MTGIDARRADGATPRHSPTLRRLRAICVASGLTLILAACSSSAHSAAGTPSSSSSSSAIGASSTPAGSSPSVVASSAPTGASSSPTEVASSVAASITDTANEPTLTVSTGSNGINYGPLWVALAKNLFEKHGVKVKVQSANAVATIQTLLESNQIDLGVTSPSQVTVLAAAGKPVSIIANVDNYTGRSVAFVGSSKTTSFDQLKAMGTHCTITATAAGTVLYAYAKKVMEVYGLKCKLATVASNPLVLAAVTAGLTNAAALTVNDAQTAASKGAHALLDPPTMTDAQAAAIVPVLIPAIVVAGLPTTLKNKSAAVVDFLAAIREATLFIEANPAETSAQLIASEPYFTGLTVAQLTASFKATNSSFPSGSDLGEISPSTWQQTLTTFASYFNLPGFDPSSTPVQYAAMVDMSYLALVQP
jgi:ABC-type nitrate/sulfonate/bicarbonate transport system substrate-binding protein